MPGATADGPADRAASGDTAATDQLTTSAAAHARRAPGAGDHGLPLRPTARVRLNIAITALVVDSVPETPVAPDRRRHPNPSIVIPDVGSFCLVMTFVTRTRPENPVEPAAGRWDHDPMQIDFDARGRVVAPRNLMISEFGYEVNSCSPQQLEKPLFLWQGESMWTDEYGVVVERLDGGITHHPLVGWPRRVTGRRPRAVRPASEAQ
ncbi:hypothetical protein ACFQZ4_07800 [Catellatospora coxensis]|uniref:Uncharacterized protein n=2 Tax=Catellatospora coxensis TaxID=310354 RepID=A0A8J3KYU4_9ACTN|nr:hypothetical protein Cco03nite_26340 [Catellatospora coxensis]